MLGGITSSNAHDVIEVDGPLVSKDPVYLSTNSCKIMVANNHMYKKLIYRKEKIGGGGGSGYTEIISS